MPALQSVYPTSVERFRESPAEFLGSDVAALNLVCACGLPGAEGQSAMTTVQPVSASTVART